MKGKANMSVARVNRPPSFVLTDLMKTNLYMPVVGTVTVVVVQSVKPPHSFKSVMVLPVLTCMQRERRKRICNHKAA